MEKRWFFAEGYGLTRADADRIKELIDTAAAHGLNGMVLSSWELDGIEKWSEADIALLREVAAHCTERGIELIPTGLSVGYGGEALGFDRSFAAAVPVEIPLRAKNGQIIAAETPNLLTNGDLEQHHGNRFPGYEFHDQPGEISFADTGVAASGKSSIRFENFGKNQHGHGRIMQKVALTPGHAYRFTFKIRTEKLLPMAGLKAMILSGDRSIASAQPQAKPTQDWADGALDFLNEKETEVAVYAGIWEGKSGRFWLDDLRFSESGDLADIVRRDGTPLELRSADRETLFVEGKDFEPIRCLSRLESIGILPGSAIREDESLTLRCYKIPFVQHPWGRQMSLCMSNPALFAHWEKQMRKLYSVVKFKRFLLSMDEIRNGGGCELCKRSGKPMAEILGDCITRQRAMLKALDPDMEVLIWSDMLDPAHNAHEHYYGVIGDFTGSWKQVPKDLTIMCWNHDILLRSLTFFSSEGFHTFGAAYYDAADLASSREWLEALRRTPHAEGIMFTTWEKKYDLLPDFGDLVSETATR